MRRSIVLYLPLQLVFPGLEQPGVNFTNILWAAFSYKGFLRSFYVVTIWVRNFWRNVFGAKAAHEMLVKLTPGKASQDQSSRKFYCTFPGLESSILSGRSNKKKGMISQVYQWSKRGIFESKKAKECLWRIIIPFSSLASIEAPWHSA
jgi:hypothetical protein